MGCSGCSSNKESGKNNSCGSYGSHKLEVFDWLSGIPLPDGQKMYDVAEVRFKNNRKSFFRNTSDVELYIGDVVVTDVSPGYDVGVVSLTGDLVKMQLRRKGVKDNYELKKILRKAKEEDIKKWHEARDLEQNTMMTARTIARDFGLEMKISDVEYQGDKSKATFYYTAEGRVDFRELIRRYADVFRVRIEMKQVGLRVEAARLGGIGSCGRELCCSTWLTDFRAVSTSAARYQQLALNPSKLSGQCGKLKCCLNYELDQYVEAIKDMPSSSVSLKLPKGSASHIKTDIFKRLMFYTYDDLPSESPFALSADAVREIQEMNRKDIAIHDLDEFMDDESNAPTVKETEFVQVVGQDSLTRFDRKRRFKKREKKDGQHQQTSGTTTQKSPIENIKAKGNEGKHSPEQSAQRQHKTNNQGRHKTPQSKNNRKHSPRNNNNKEQGNKES